MNMDAYLSSKNRFDKSMVVNTVLTAIKVGGGRFLQQKKGQPGWFDVDDKFARDKISHAVRDAITFRQANPGCRFPTTTTTCFRQVSATDGEDILVSETLVPSTRANVSVLSNQSIIKAGTKEKRNYSASSLIELMTPCQMMMANVKICQEEFLALLQRQQLPPQEQDEDILFDDVFNDDDSDDNLGASSVQSALELASTILIRGTSNHMEHDESSLSLEDWLNNTSPLSTKLETALKIDTFLYDSLQSSLDVLDFEDREDCVDDDMFLENMKIGCDSCADADELKALYCSMHTNDLLEKIRSISALPPC
jgi:hypothetical protein